MINVNLVRSSNTPGQWWEWPCTYLLASSYSLASKYNFANKKPFTGFCRKSTWDMKLNEQTMFELLLLKHFPGYYYGTSTNSSNLNLIQCHYEIITNYLCPHLHEQVLAGRFNIYIVLLNPVVLHFRFLLDLCYVNLFWLCSINWSRRFM